MAHDLLERCIVFRVATGPHSHLAWVVAEQVGDTLHVGVHEEIAEAFHAMTQRVVLTVGLEHALEIVLGEIVEELGPDAFAERRDDQSLPVTTGFRCVLMAKGERLDDGTRVDRWALWDYDHLLGNFVSRGDDLPEFDRHVARWMARRGAPTRRFIVRRVVELMSPTA